MGGCCGKQSSSDAFAGPGRVVGSVPPKKTTAAVPASVGGGGGGALSSSPGRTLGGGSSSGAGGGAADDARRRAAEAAEARSKAKPTGKLGSQLEAQKKKTMNETLKDAANENRRQRELDNQTQTLSHS